MFLSSSFFCYLTGNVPFKDTYRDIPVLSALLFAGKYLGRVCPTALFDTAFTGVERRGPDQRAGTTGIGAVRVLTTLVAELVQGSADLWRVTPAREVKAMAAGEPAAERCRGSCCYHGRGRAALQRGCAACGKQCEEGDPHR
jgi:hypothetical protein